MRSASPPSDGAGAAPSGGNFPFVSKPAAWQASCWGTNRRIGLEQPTVAMISGVEAPRLQGLQRGRLRVERWGPKRPRVWELWAERGLDTALAVVALLFAAPLIVLFAALIKLQDGGPVFFAQTRVGRYGRVFRCYKLRSMVPDAQVRLDALLASDPGAHAEWARDHKLKRDPRITALGAFLRRTSLDELPQLLNIIRGEMSLVGPRPIVQAEVAKYGRWFRHYTRLKPGLTGMWQVSGRNDTTYMRRVALDIVYSRSRSLRLYLYILFRTAPAVLARRGSY